MHTVKRGVFSCIIVMLLMAGSAYAETAKVKPPKKIGPKAVQKADKKAVLTSNEKAIQRAQKKSIHDQQQAFRNSNKQTAKQFRAMQKAYEKSLREQARRSKKQ